MKSRIITFLFLMATIHLYAEQDSLEILAAIDSAGKVESIDEAVEVYLYAINASKKIAFDKGYVRGLIRLSTTFRKKGNYLKALKYGEQAVKYSSKKKLFFYLGILKNHQGAIYQEMGNYNKSIANYLEAEEYLKIAKKHKFLASTNINLGIIYKAQGQIDDAIKNYSKAYKIAKNNNMVVVQVNALLNKALAFVAIGQYDSTNRCLDLAIPLARKANYQLGLGTLLSTKFDVFMANNQLDSATRYLNLALQNHKMISIPYRLAGLKIKKGFLKRLKGNFTESIASCKEALLIAKEIKAKELEKSACGCLQKGYLKQNNYKKAHFYLSEFKTIEDSLKRKELSQILKNRTHQLEIQEADNRVIAANLGKEQEKNLRLKTQGDLERKTFMTTSLLLILSLVVLALILIFRLNRKIKSQKDIISLSLKEKELLLSEVHHRVKNNLQLISSILHLQSSGIIDEDVKGVFKESQAKIASISAIHQKLYQTENFGNVNLEDYLQDLIESLVSSLSCNNNIDVNYQIASYRLEIGKSIPLGLIVTELITNAIKHGGEQLQLNITLKQLGNQLKIEVWNNGINFDPEVSKKSFGLRMIKSLTRQLKGDFTIEAKEGTLAQLIFKK